MNKLCKKPLAACLGMLCLVSLSCGPGLLHAQQLTPAPLPPPKPVPVQLPGPDALQPIMPVVNDQADPSALPPVISVNQMLATDGQQDAVPGQAAAVPLGPPRPGPDMLMPIPVGHTPVASGREPVEMSESPVRGRNFPADAEERIARFVQENQTSGVPDPKVVRSLPANPETGPKTPKALQLPPGNVLQPVPRPQPGDLPRVASRNARPPVTPTEPAAEPVAEPVAEPQPHAVVNNQPAAEPVAEPAAPPIEPVTPARQVPLAINQPATPLAIGDQGPQDYFQEQPVGPSGGIPATGAMPIVNRPSWTQPPSNANGWFDPQQENLLPGPVEPGLDGGPAGESYFEQTPWAEYPAPGVYPGEGPAAGYDHGAIADTFACCGFIPDATRYFIADILWWHRGEGVVRAGNFSRLDDFSWKGGGRFTIGRRRDCTRGGEISFTGFDPWLSTTTQTSATGQLMGAIYGSLGGYPESAFSAFRGSVYLDQLQKTRFYSAEINQTWWGSDVAKAFLGFRFMYLDDEFRLSSLNTAGQRGYYTLNTTNNLFGFHMGSEVLYDIGYRLSFSLGGKLGGYANFWEGRRGLLNNNILWMSSTRQSTDFSASAELGAFARYKLGPRSRLRFGYEVLGLTSVYDVESNFNSVVTPASGVNYRNGGTLFHGASFGFEIYR